MSVSDTENMRINQAAWSEGWRKSPLWLRLLGGPKTYYANRGSYRLPWGELSLSRCSIGLAVGGYETAHFHIAWGLGQAFIRLPFLDKAICQGPNSIEQPRFGFSLHGRTDSAIAIGSSGSGSVRVPTLPRLVAWRSPVFLRRLQKRFSRPIDTIDIRFSAEVGSRAGSWKGGTIGCSYEMNPGETPEHTLRRMQAVRRFR